MSVQERIKGYNKIAQTIDTWRMPQQRSCFILALSCLRVEPATLHLYEAVAKHTSVARTKGGLMLAEIAAQQLAGNAQKVMLCDLFGQESNPNGSVINGGLYMICASTLDADINRARLAREIAHSYDGCHNYTAKALETIAAAIPLR